MKLLKPQGHVLGPRIARRTDVEGHDPVREFWRPWYKSAEWLELRADVFARDNYTCQMQGCGVVTRRPHADHRIPHRGDRRLFFDPRNVQTLCPPCHNGKKQAAERRLHPRGG